MLLHRHIYFGRSLFRGTFDKIEKSTFPLSSFSAIWLRKPIPFRGGTAKAFSLNPLLFKDFTSTDFFFG
jgi:hypothetical protein